MNDSPSALLAAAQDAARTGDREQARTAFYAVIDREPDNLDAWLWLGAIADDPEDAVAYLQRALEINPRSIRARKGIEWAQARLGSSPPAAPEIAPALAPAPPPHVLPGVDTAGLQPMTQPLAAYQSPPGPARVEPAPVPPPPQPAPAGRETIQVTPQAATPPAGPTPAAPAADDQLDWDAIMARLQAGDEVPTAGSADLDEGKRLLEASDFAGAVTRLRAAIGAAPRNVEAHEQLGVAYYQIGQAEAALAEFQQVVRLDPQRAEAHANIGFIHADLGDPAAAAAAFRSHSAICSGASRTGTAPWTPTSARSKSTPRSRRRFSASPSAGPSGASVWRRPSCSSARPSCGRSTRKPGRS